jgi:hypothetical protein
MLIRLTCNYAISACGEGFVYNIDAPSPVIIVCQQGYMLTANFGNLGFDIPFSSYDSLEVTERLNQLSERRENTCIKLRGEGVIEYINGSYCLSCQGIIIMFDCNTMIFKVMARAVMMNKDNIFNEQDIERA